jgi:hypothetical protein
MANEQGGPEPQAQRPSLPQESAVSGSHAAHSAPPVPHAAELGDRQSPAAVQQPLQLSQPDMGAARMTFTARSTPNTTPTRARPSATTPPASNPSTKMSSVCRSSASASSTRTVDSLGSSAPSVSGRSVGPNTTVAPSLPV